MKRIVAYKNYYRDFMLKLTENERTKIKRALLLFETEDKIPRHYISYIRDGLFEFRVTGGNKEFRMFYIYDGDKMVILFNCFIKKSTKTPKKEIDKGLKLMEEYQHNDLIVLVLCTYLLYLRKIRRTKQQRPLHNCLKAHP